MVKVIKSSKYEVETDKSWDSGFKPITECPYMRSNKVVLVSKELVDMAKLLSSELPGYEWLLYCEMDEDETSIMVHDCVIPKQKVSYSTVEVKKGMNLPVVVHSHHNMKYGEFSSVDDEYINSNHKMSILWTDDKGIAKVILRRDLPCGHVALTEVNEVMIYMPQDYDYEKVKEKVREQIRNIEKETYTYTYRYGKNSVYPGIYGEYLDDVEREYRKILGDYGYDDPWWERWEEVEGEVVGEETPELWKKK